MDNKIESNNITYFHHSGIDFLIVGHGNSTNYENNLTAIPNSTEFETIEIPKYVSGYFVKEIGCNAFRKCIYLKEVNIKAEITQINWYAFYECHNLTSINIPSTCELMGNGAISSVIWIDKYNQSTAPGTLSVKFEPNATIKTIGEFAIERKEVIIITYCGYHEPYVVNKSLFYETRYPVVYSPIPIKWGGIDSIVDTSICNLLQDYKEAKEIKIPTCKSDPI